MAEHAEILASLLDDCWEPQSAIEFLRSQARGPHERLAQAEAVCFLVPGGEVGRARVVTEAEEIDDTLPPGRTRYLWGLATGTPSREYLLRLYEEH